MGNCFHVWPNFPYCFGRMHASLTFPASGSMKMTQHSEPHRHYLHSKAQAPPPRAFLAWFLTSFATFTLCSLTSYYFPRRKQMPLTNWAIIYKDQDAREKPMVFWGSPTTTGKGRPRSMCEGCRLETGRDSASSCPAAAASAEAPSHSPTWLSADSVDSSGLRREGFSPP